MLSDYQHSSKYVKKVMQVEIPRNLWIQILYESSQNKYFLNKLKNQLKPLFSAISVNIFILFWKILLEKSKDILGNDHFFPSGYVQHH